MYAKTLVERDDLEWMHRVGIAGPEFRCGLQDAASRRQAFGVHDAGMERPHFDYAVKLGDKLGLEMAIAVLQVGASREALGYSRLRV